MRSGDEPAHARSPLRLRLVLACVGIVSGVAGAMWCATQGLGPLTVAFTLVAAVAAVDAVVVLARIRSGPHWQPGRDVPPYRPLAPTPRPPAQRPAPGATEPGTSAPEGLAADQRRRLRRYLWVMGSCVLLLANAWTWVRLVSTPTAVGMTLVAMVLPPIAAVLGSPPINRR